jgi:hypothetical protein
MGVPVWITTSNIAVAVGDRVDSLCIAHRYVRSYTEMT